jgi:hypothetical protein
MGRISCRFGKSTHSEKKARPTENENKLLILGDDDLEDVRIQHSDLTPIRLDFVFHISLIHKRHIRRF